MDHPQGDTNLWERRFRSARNVALAIGGTATVAYTEVSNVGLKNASVVALAAASNLELWRIFASPDSERRRKFMNKIHKAAGAMSLYMAATWAVEGVTLIANDTEPVTLGAVNMHNFVTQEEDWVPETNGATAAYAAADALVAAYMAKVGVSAFRRKETPYPDPGFPNEQPA